MLGQLPGTPRALIGAEAVSAPLVFPRTRATHQLRHDAEARGRLGLRANRCRDSKERGGLGLYMDVGNALGVSAAFSSRFGFRSSPPVW